MTSLHFFLLRICSECAWNDWEWARNGVFFCTQNELEFTCGSTHLECVGEGKVLLNSHRNAFLIHFF